MSDPRPTSSPKATPAFTHAHAASTLRIGDRGRSWPVHPRQRSRGEHTSMPDGPDLNDKVGIFFDMSNLYFAARDMGIRIDYTRLLEFLVDRRRLHRAYAYIGVSPDDENRSFITW